MMRILAFLLIGCSLWGGEISYFPEDPNLETFLEEMPWDLYEVYEVEGLGKFYLDDAKDCIKDTLKEGKLWEHYIHKVLKKHLSPGDVALDIGGHIGTIALSLSKFVGEEGSVYAFEGEHQFFRELVKNIALNHRKNIYPHLCWIGKDNGTMNLDEESHFISLAYSPVCAMVPREVSIAMRTIDSFEFERVDLIKIDVECSENDVLDGAIETLKRCRPILVIEIMGGYGNDYSKEIREKIKGTIQKLESLEYDVELIWGDDYLAIPREKK